MTLLVCELAYGADNVLFAVRNESLFVPVLRSTRAPKCVRYAEVYGSVHRHTPAPPPRVQNAFHVGC